MFNTDKAITQIKNDLAMQTSLTNTVAKNVLLVMHYGNSNDNERLADIFRKDGQYHSQRSRITEAKKILSYGQENKIPLGKKELSLTDFISDIENDKINPSLSVVYKAINSLEKARKESPEYQEKQAKKEQTKHEKAVIQFAIDSDVFNTHGINKPSDFLKLLENEISAIPAMQAFEGWEQAYNEEQGIKQALEQGENASNDKDTIKDWLNNCYAMNPEVFQEIANHVMELQSGAMDDALTA